MKFDVGKGFLARFELDRRAGLSVTPASASGACGSPIK